jgi:2-amino-4-hydroxy-6-hydroxymethyldihydropteridine diphosphokinase
MTYGIALGSNLGDRAANLRRGVAMLRERVAFTALLEAPVYETAPVDCAPGTQAFLNTVIEIACPLPPHELHAHLKAIETAMGRPEQHERNSPRTLDLDILYAGGLRLDDATLTIPHPRLHQRRFVLQPLADIRPGLVLPGFTQTISELLSALDDAPDSVRVRSEI